MMLPFILGFIFVLFAIFAAILINRVEKEKDEAYDKIRKLTLKYNDLYNSHELLVKEYNQLRKDVVSRYGNRR